MEKKNTKKALEESYRTLEPFSKQYKTDFKRFLFSLDLLSFESNIKNKRILDVGSGIGIAAIALKNLGADVVGADKFIFPDEAENFYTISDFSNLKRVWEQNNFNIIKSDISKEKLPFHDNYFDIVNCDAVIEHFNESPNNLFQEARRVLKNKGLFSVTTPNLANLLKRLRFLLGRSPNWNTREYFENGQNFRGHIREFIPSELVQMLEWSSFEIIKKKTKNVFFNPRRLFSPKKAPAHLCCFLSYPFPSMRDMIYVLARKV